MDRAASRPRPDWVFWSLLVAAVLTRVVWAVWVHPPHEHVFSDMAHYLRRAQLVAHGLVVPGMREMVWQAWGTHMLLAIPIWLVGPGRAALEVAGLMWAGFSAASVMLGHALALRVLPGPRDAHAIHWPALVVGVLLLGWFPLLSHTGFFISETPYTCVLLATTLALVRLVSREGEDHRTALSLGCWSAFAFALRPQSIVFLVLALPIVWLERRRSSSAPLDRRALLYIALPLLIVLAVSLVRVRVHAGQWGGVSENASMNLTAGRCHNVVTRSWASQDDLDSSLATGDPPPLRRVSLPGFRALAREGDDHPLALRPALGGEAIDMVGYIGDRELHRDIRRRCWAATGWLGQLRYSVTNVALLWVVARPWPESSDHPSPELLPVALRSRTIAAWLAPLALLGLCWSVLRWSRGRGSDRAADLAAGLAVCAVQLASLLIVAAVFFGTPRLRTPYDPYALLLCVALLTSATRWLAARR